MNRMVVFSAVMIAACQGAPEPPVEEFTDAHRAQIEAEVTEIVKELRTSARDVDPAPMMAYIPEEAGVCVWGSTLYSCKEIFDRYAENWTAQEGNRLERQEMDDEEIRVMAVSPTVVVAGRTTQETRGFYTNGEVTRARFSNLTVFVLEKGEWKMHSVQQASWPILDETED